MQIFYHLFFIFCGLVICKGDVENNGGVPLIIGGENATMAEFPWIINMVLNDGSNFHRCGGIILNTEWVLTAAHCVYGIENSLNYIALIAGDHDQSAVEPTEQRRLAIKAVLHPQYSPVTFDYDFALLKVSESFQFTNSVLSASLPENSNDANGVLTVAGWGFTTPGEGGRTSPDILQKVSLPIIERATCRLRYREIIPITERMICAAEGMKAPCNGDSGSGFVKRSGNDDKNHVVHGVVSFGKRGCDGGEQLPTVFANVPSVIPWITNTMERDNDSTITESDNGSTTTESDNGSTTTESDNGSTTTESDNGSTTTEKDNGSTTTKRSNGGNEIPKLQSWLVLLTVAATVFPKLLPML